MIQIACVWHFRIILPPKKLLIGLCELLLPMVFSPNEKDLIKEFTMAYGIDADEMLKQASKSLVGNKPEVEIVDYRAKNGLLFEQLVVSFLKDKSRFNLLSWTGDKYYKGIYDRTNLNPDLHIEQTTNGTAIDYYIECKWLHYWQRGEKGYFFDIKPEQLRRYRRFASKNRRVVMIAFGYGRTGDNPRGLYLIPCAPSATTESPKTSPTRNTA